jgi:uncharacterized protein (DUF3084 family)
MVVRTEEAQELVESVFDFDHVGDEMQALRKDLDSSEAREALVEAVVRAAREELEDVSGENAAVLATAAETRVDEFIKGAKFSESGCSGLGL